MEDAPAGFVPAKFAKGFLDLSGPYFIEAGGGARMALRIDASHANYVGVAHGGVLATFADVAMSFQVHNSERPQLQVVSNSLTVNFLAGVKEGDWVEARCRLDRKGKRIAYASGAIWRGEDMVMTMTGVYTIIR